MRSTFFAIIAALLVGCATTPDPIDRLVTDLSATHGLWVNGIDQGVDLPKTASPKQVVQQVFRMAGITRYKFLKIREVRIPVGMPEELYTAVLAQTSPGEKIVLIRYELGHWWYRIYDAKTSA